MKIKFGKIIRNTDPSRTIAHLEECIERGLPITIDYVDEKGERTLRTVEPYATVTTQRGRIIVRSMCRLRGESRSFAPDSIDAYTVHKGRCLVEREVDETAEPVTPPTTPAELIERELLRDPVFADDPEGTAELAELLAAA